MVASVQYLTRELCQLVFSRLRPYLPPPSTLRWSQSVHAIQGALDAVDAGLDRFCRQCTKIIAHTFIGDGDPVLYRTPDERVPLDQFHGAVEVRVCDHNLDHRLRISLSQRLIQRLRLWLTDGRLRTGSARPRALPPAHAKSPGNQESRPRRWTTPTVSDSATRIAPI